MIACPGLRDADAGGDGDEGYYEWGAVEGKAAVLLTPAQWTRIS